MSTFRALHEVIGESGLFCSLYTDRASHYWHTPAAGGKVDKDNPTQVGRALAQLGIELIAALFARGAGALGAYVRDPSEAPAAGAGLAGITTMEDANRYLTGGLLAGSQPALRAARRGVRLGLRGLRRHPRRHPRRPAPPPGRQRRTRCATTTSSCRSRPTASATTTPRPTVPSRTNIPTASWPSSDGPQVPGPLQGRQHLDRNQQGAGRRDPLRRDRPPRPCGWWTARHSRPDHFPTGPTAATKRSIHMVHKPVNSAVHRPVGFRGSCGHTLREISLRLVGNSGPTDPR